MKVLLQMAAFLSCLIEPKLTFSFFSFSRKHIYNSSEISTSPQKKIIAHKRLRNPYSFISPTASEGGGSPRNLLSQNHNEVGALVQVSGHFWVIHEV